MVKTVFFNSDGRITRVVVASQNHHQALVDKECGAVEIPCENNISDSTHYVSAGNVVEFPDRPSEYHEWDFAVGQWIIKPGRIESAKQSAKDRINAAWKSAEKEPFAAYGKTFDADDKAIQRILGAAQAALVAKSLGQPLSIEWTCADNSTLMMDADMLSAIPIIVAQAADALHKKYMVLKGQIEAAAALEQVEAVVW